MFKRIFSSDDISPDLGLLLVRLGVGASMAIFHGWDKITGGPETWNNLGKAMESVNITFVPVFWGFMSAFAESVCSALLAVGLLFRPTAMLLALNMFIAVMRHLDIPAGEPGAGWSGASHALELLSVYLCLMFAGPGKFSLTPRGKA